MFPLRNAPDPDPLLSFHLAPAKDTPGAFDLTVITPDTTPPGPAEEPGLLVQVLRIDAHTAQFFKPAVARVMADVAPPPPRTLAELFRAYVGDC